MAATHHVVMMQMRFMTKPASIMSGARKEQPYRIGESHTSWVLHGFLVKEIDTMTMTAKHWTFMCGLLEYYLTRNIIG
jgi:hypothetical protein